jgi:hypothetical protein
MGDICVYYIVSFLAGEQPPSSMAPAILSSSSGKNTLVIGGSGGSMIMTAMALVSLDSGVLTHFYHMSHRSFSTQQKNVFFLEKDT